MNQKTGIVLFILILLFIGGSIELNLFINRPEPQQPMAYDHRVAFQSLQFDYPNGIYSSGDGKNRLFIVEQMGYIYVFDNDERNVQSASVFLDVHDHVHLGALLGRTFHPNFSKNGLFYVYYLADNPT